jgi:TonB family protein
MTPAADLFRALPALGKGLALLGSVSVHAAVALAAVRGAPHAALNANLAADAVVEVAGLELDLAEAPLPAESPTAPPARATAAATRAHHHHDYPVQPDHDAADHDASLRHALPSQPAPSPVAAAAPTVIDAPALTAPRFEMTVGPVPRALGGATAESAVAQAGGERASGEPASEVSVDTPAKLLRGGLANYTREAEAAGIEADVPLEIVVDSAGSVVSARVVSRVGYGLDEAALRSIRAYRFTPALRAGKALAVRMRWLMRFQLR